MAKKLITSQPLNYDYGPFGPTNLLQVLAFVEWSAVDDDKRWKRVAALKMMARLQGASEENICEVLRKIPADVPLLRNYLRRQLPLKRIYDARTLRNMRSHLFAAIRASGVRVRVQCRRVPLPSSWQQLLDALHPRSRSYFYGFARFCVERNLEPQDVSQSHFEAYEQFLLEFDGRRCPRRTYLDLCHAWNAARASVAAWPRLEVSIPSRYDRFILSWSAFAPSFHDEILRMTEQAVHPPLDTERRRSPLRPVTAKHQADVLRRVASALVAQTGRDPKSITSVADLVDPAAAREALRFLIQRARRRHQ